MFSLLNLKRINFGISLTIRYFSGTKSPKHKWVQKFLTKKQKIWFDNLLFLCFFCRLEYRDISGKYYPAVLKHLAHNFFVDEPLIRTITPLKTCEFMAYAENDVLKMLSENFSVMAVNDNNEVEMQLWFLLVSESRFESYILFLFLFYISWKDCWCGDKSYSMFGRLGKCKGPVAYNKWWKL